LFGCSDCKLNPKDQSGTNLPGAFPESGASQASEGDCDENFSDDKAKKKPIADQVTIGMKMVIRYQGRRGAPRECTVEGMGRAVNDVC
jgi:hypothetical protein